MNWTSGFWCYFYHCNSFSFEEKLLLLFLRLTPWFDLFHPVAASNFIFLVFLIFCTNCFFWIIFRILEASLGDNSELYTRAGGRESEGEWASRSFAYWVFLVFWVYHQITQKGQVKALKKKQNLSPSVVFECFLKSLQHFFSICRFSYCSDSKWEASWKEMWKIHAWYGWVWDFHKQFHFLASEINFLWHWMETC